MKYEKIFMGSYNLHLINTDKFKTTTIEINFRSKLNDNNTIRNLLKMVLLMIETLILGLEMFYLMQKLLGKVK